jgi:hypothetical protein
MATDYSDDNRPSPTAEVREYESAPYETHMTDLCRIQSIMVRSGSEIAEKYNDRTFITIPDRALVLEDSYRQVYVLVGSDDELQKLAGTILERINGDPLRQLLVDWFDAEMFQISETGSSADWQSVVDDAKARHETFGIEWNDAFLPDYVREMLAINEED